MYPNPPLTFIFFCIFFRLWLYLKCYVPCIFTSFQPTGTDDWGLNSEDHSTLRDCGGVNTILLPMTIQVLMAKKLPEDIVMLPEAKD